MSRDCENGQLRSGLYRVEPLMNSLRQLKIAQLNMARLMAVSDEFFKYCISNSVDIAIAQESYTRWGVMVGLECDSVRTAKCMINEQNGVWAAIIVFNNRLGLLLKPHLTTVYTVTIGVAFTGQTTVDVVSSYFQLRKPTELFVQENTSLHPHWFSRSIVGMDVNAFSNL